MSSSWCVGKLELYLFSEPLDCKFIVFEHCETKEKGQAGMEWNAMITYL